jgi:pimeloyl-ACP methyl ester carboxylesterase
MPIFPRILLYLVIIYLSFVCMIYLRQDSYIFFPVKHQDLAGRGPDTVAYELRLPDITLRGWLLNADQAGDKLLIYYGGNAEDIFSGSDDFQKLPGAATLLVPYRGYGANQGEPSEEKLFADATAIHADITARYAPREIFLLGRSLGSGVATYLASRKKVQGVILVTPFDSMVNMAREAFPVLPASLILKHRFDSLTNIVGITCPIMVIYGGRDTIVPNARTENLLRHIPGPYKTVFLAEAGHNDIGGFAEYWSSVACFLEESSL